MSANRIYNFNAGPAALPLPVLEEIQASFLNYAGSGMSVTEISHRSKWFDDIVNDADRPNQAAAQSRDDFHVVVPPGRRQPAVLHGAHELSAGREDRRLREYRHLVDQSHQGSRVLGKTVKVIASSEDKNFSYIPAKISVNPDAAYVHITSNNTIKGTQWQTFPDTGGVPIIADMSSDFMSRPFEAAPFGLIYAGAQKNIGPAGVCMVIIRDDMLAEIPDKLPAMLSYTHPLFQQLDV